MKKNFYITIEGNIGSGKTSLAGQLAGDLNAQFLPEEFAGNSFLPLFYKDPRRYAFPLEMSFLAARYGQITGGGLFGNDIPIISDYHIYKSKLFASVTLKEEERILFDSFFQIIQPLVPVPDLLVFLNNSAESSRRNIEKRNRGFEKDIPLEYLKNLENNYLKTISEFPASQLLVIETESLDFVNQQSDYEHIKTLILRKLSAICC